MTAAYGFRERPDGSQTKNPVRRLSRASGGDWERNYAVAYSKGELARHMRVMRAHRGRLRRIWWDKPLAERDRAEAPPTELHLGVLEALVAMAAGGRRMLAVSYFDLARRARCSIAAVHRAIVRLQRVGMLDWARRCRPTGADPAFGQPQWEQDVNLYRLLWPAGVKRQMVRAGREEDDRRAARAAAAARDQRQAEREGRAPAIAPPRPPPPPRGAEPAAALTDERRAQLAELRARIDAQPRRHASRE